MLAPGLLQANKGCFDSSPVRRLYYAPCMPLGSGRRSRQALHTVCHSQPRSRCREAALRRLWAAICHLCSVVEKSLPQR